MAEYYDIDFSFGLDSTGDIKRVDDIQAINQSLQNIILSRKGSKPGTGSFNENYGVGLEEFQYAPLNNFTANRLSRALQQAIGLYEPRVKILMVNVGINNKERRFEVNIEYSVAKKQQVFNFKTVINQL